MTLAAPNNSPDARQEAIAIVGMACIFPGAANLQQYWNNIQTGVCALTDVPENRWDPLFYDPSSPDPDRFYCRKGGFVDDYVDFDPLAYGVMPKAAESADPDQLLSLRVGVEALKDAGLWEKDFNRKKTGVVIGRGNYLSAGTLRLEQHVRVVQQTLQTLQDLIPTISESQLQAVRAQMKSELSYYGPDTAVGLIPNLVASRLANRLDFNGPAYTVDAACASALLAVEQSCQLLRQGDADVMLTGGLHFTHDLTFWATFCQLGALSRTDCIRPFSARADGILAGEGIGLVVLKRLDDAVRAGDRIYSVIHGIASASDGKSSSLLAPAVEGQKLALERAWQQTALKRDAIGLLEAHGTGTPAGDNAELETISAFFGEAVNPDLRAGLGSVKSMIGHTMPASGAAGLIKAALSVYHGVKPMTLEVDDPNPLIAKTRFKLQEKTESWDATSESRIAAVNAFGFGGINAHAVIGGYPEQEVIHNPIVSSIPEVIRLAAPTQKQLLEKLHQRVWESEGQSENFNASAETWRLAIIAPNPKRLAMAKTIVEKGKPWHGRNQIYFSHDMLLGAGKVAFLFPGVDSAFNPQLKDVAEFFNLPLPAYCEKLDPAQDLLKVGLGLTGVNKLLNQVLERLSVVPAGMAGHSIGEWSAMAASGCLSQTLIDEVNAKMDPNSLEVPDVVFLAVAAGIDRVRGLFEDLAELYLSHDNCPHQIIFCGRKSSVATLSTRLQSEKILWQVLPIVSGFHSPLLAEYARPFVDFFNQVELSSPRIPLWSANSASEFPSSDSEKKQLIENHLLDTVRFRELIENMYTAGFRAFIQVGVGSLPGFVDDSLKSKPHLALSANTEKRSGLEQLCHVLAGLWVEGYAPDFSVLGLQKNRAAGETLTGTESTASASMRLQLGVPLIRLSKPLDLAAEQLPALIDSELPINDPLANLFQQTLEDIQLASDDVRRLWMSRTQPVRTSSRAFQPETRTLPMRLDVNDNIPFVLDHAFYPQAEGWPVVADRHPVIPLTMEISLMRNAVRKVIPGMEVIAMENVRAFNWLIVDTPVDIEIIVEHLEPGFARVSIDGYAEASVRLADAFPTAPKPDVIEWQNPRDTAVSAQALYADNWMFHGPAYQSISQLGPIADNGIQGRLRVSSGEGALLDNMGQLAGYWVMEQDVDCLAMPIGIREIHFYGPDPAQGDELRCDVEISSLTHDSCESNLQLLDERGQINVVINGWQTRRYSMDKRFWIHSKQVQKYLLSETYPEGFVVFEDHYDAAITRDYLAKRYLNQPETEQYRLISPRRKRQWLSGRVAVKDAIRHCIWSHNGKTDLWPKEIGIDNDSNGRPFAYPHISKSYNDDLYISLAHKDRLSVAIASKQAVGIDIEVIEPRSHSLIEAAMTEQEEGRLRMCTLDFEVDELVTRIWAAKEALAKSRGTGFEGRPKDFVVDEILEDGLVVNGQWVCCRKYKNYIICWTE